MTELNLNFTENQILTSDEMNLISGKIDDIIRLLSSLDGVSSVGDAQVVNKINDVEDELEKISETIKYFETLPDGIHSIVTKEDLTVYDKLADQVAAITLSYKGIDLSAYKDMKDKMDEISKWASSLSIEPGKIELLASLVSDKDEDGNYEFLIPPAKIIAAITERDGSLKSEIKISADNIDLSGYVTAQDLSANYISTDQLGDFENRVKNAVIDNLDGITINGVNINGGSLNIGNGKFTVDSSGKLIASDAEIKGVIIPVTVIVNNGDEYTLPDAEDGAIYYILAMTASDMLNGNPAEIKCSTYNVQNGSNKDALFEYYNGSWNTAGSALPQNRHTYC